MSKVPQKIILRTATKISLNERFSNIKPQIKTVPLPNRQNVYMKPVEVSYENQILSEQIEKRQSVKAALLMDDYRIRQAPTSSRISVHQRLGEIYIPKRLPVFNRTGQINNGKHSYNNIKRYGRFRKFVPFSKQRQHMFPYRKRSFKYRRPYRMRFLKKSQPLKNMTKEDLDKQLDDYMSLSKKYLDDQLNNYMAEKF